MKNHIEGISVQLKQSSDRLMNYFLAGYFAIGLILSFYFDTWLVGLGVGSLLLVAYYSSKKILPNSGFYQYVLSAAIGIFMAQFIYQMHGMFEMHFFAFIGSAILITYRNWKLQIPLAFIVLIHHSVFAYLQFIGYNKVYFTQLDYMPMQEFVLHTLLTIIIFSICGFWSYRFKKTQESQIAQSFEVGKLQEENNQKELMLAINETLKSSNAQLKEANNELGKIFNTVEEVLFSMDAINWRIIHISIACIKVYGYTPAEVIADSELWAKVIHPDDLHIINGYLEKLKEGKTVAKQYRIIHKNKSTRWIEAKLIPTLNEDGLLVRVDGICNDITEKVTLENKLAEEKWQKQKQITDAVLTAQENERSFLGEELHDNINPILATAKLYMECAVSREESRIKLVEESRGFIIIAMEEIRKLSKRIIAPSLGEVGLRMSISDMIGNIKQVNNDIKFITLWEELDESLLTDKLKLTVFRIVQEQMNNIFKYAKAQTVFIELKQEGRFLILIVKDDGIGFNPSQKRQGVGLQNICSRASLFNGEVIINSEPGKGCELISKFNTQQESVYISKNLRA